MKFAKSFNQPIAVFLTLASTPTPSPSDKRGAVASFDVQYFSPNCKVEPCGRDIFAAIKVILDSVTNQTRFGAEGSRFPTLSSPETHAMEFTTAEGIIVTARKVDIPHEISGGEEV